MIARILLSFALAVALSGAAAPGLAPFLPAPTPVARIVKVLAPPDFIERSVIEAFERESGATVALDVYAGAAELAERSAEERYDVVLLRGPALARRLASGVLSRLDRRRLPNARLVHPLVALKYAAYDRDGAFGERARLVGRCEGQECPARALKNGGGGFYVGGFGARRVEAGEFPYGQETFVARVRPDDPAARTQRILRDSQRLREGDRRGLVSVVD